jgi:6-phosphogluconate dehydrogenase
MMVGGELRLLELLEPVSKRLPCGSWWGWVGPSGAGHYAKMVHNGISMG